MRLGLYRGKWAAVWHDGKQTRRKSLGTADRHLADRRFRDLKIEAPNDTVTDAVTLYLIEKENVARSFEGMMASWKALKPIFGHLKPEQVDVALCRRFTAKRRAAGRSNGTVIRDLGFLRTALKWAKRPGATFEFPSAPAPRTRYLTRKEYDRLLASCKAPHIHLFVILALATGGRASAILELTWDRVDFEHERVQLSTGEERRKGRATVPMTQRALRALQEAQESRTCDYVIEWAGQPVRSVKRAFREAAGKAKLKGVTPHVLRHTAAVWMAEAGTSMDEIAQFLGHTTPAVTFRTYARFSPQHLRKAAEALE